MKKFFSFFVAMIAAMAMNATVVTFTPADFAGMGTANTGSEVTLTKDGVTVTCDKAYGHDLALRCYKGSVLTISATESINALEMTYAVVSGTNYNGGGLENVIMVNATSWTNTMAAQARIESLKVYLGEDPTDGPVATVDTISVAQARARIDAGQLGECYIYGRVDSMQTQYISQYKNINVWISDLEDSSLAFEVYKMKGVNGADINSEAEVPCMIGDEILVHAASIALYKSTYETTSANFCEVLGGVEAIDLGLTRGMALYDNEYNELAFELETNQGVLSLVFEHAKANSIKGTYMMANAVELTLGNASLMGATGSMSVDYNKEASLYDVNLVIVAANATYKGNAQLALGNFSDDLPFVVPAMPEGCLTAAEAQAAGLALPDPDEKKTNYGEEVMVRGFVTFAYDAAVSSKTGIYSQSAWIADEEGAKTGLVQAYYAKVEEGKEVVVGDYVEVRGQLAKYNKGTEFVIEIVSPKEGVCTMVRVKDLTEGIFNTEAAVKAVKVMENGQLIIIRNGEKYNAAGARL